MASIDTAVKLCEQRYGNIGSGCGKCPIHRECTTGLNGWSAASLTEWQGKVENAARFLERE